MTRRREKQHREQPIEETLHVAMSEVVGAYGEVEVERHSYDWRADDLLVWVRVREALVGTTRSLFRRRVAATMQELCPAGQTFEDWLVVVQRGADTVDTIAWHDKTDGNEEVWGET